MFTLKSLTEAEKITHRWGVVAKDRFMSGWGDAAGGASRCAWACKPEDLHECEKRIRDRKKMLYVNIVDLNAYRPPRGTAHFHIYVNH